MKGSNIKYVIFLINWYIPMVVFEKLYTKRAFLFSNRQDVLLGIQNHIATEQCSLENIYTDKDHNALGH